MSMLHQTRPGETKNKFMLESTWFIFLHTDTFSRNSLSDLNALQKRLTLHLVIQRRATLSDVSPAYFSFIIFLKCVLNLFAIFVQSFLQVGSGVIRKEGEAPLRSAHQRPTWYYISCATGCRECHIYFSALIPQEQMQAQQRIQTRG